MLEQTDGVVPPLVLPQLLVLRLAKHGPVLLEVAEDREADRVSPVLPDPVHKPPVPAHPRTTRVGIVLSRTDGTAACAPEDDIALVADL